MSYTVRHLDEHIAENSIDVDEHVLAHYSAKTLEGARYYARLIVLASPDSTVTELGYTRKAPWVMEALASIGDVGDPHTEAEITAEGGAVSLPNGSVIEVVPA
jgi:hypothetical protein